jgi:SAM-dependent methyltransferase
MISKQRDLALLERAGRERRTVVLAETLSGDDAAARAQLALAWQRVKPGGRLVVVVPNALADKRPGARKRRELQRLLEPFGKPQLGTEQPFCWLLMYVKKLRPGEPLVRGAVAQRYEVMAGLCRGHVLELGCGRGHLTATVAALGHSVVGMDISARKIQVAAAHYPHLRFFQGDAARLDMRGEVFDTVILAEVLEHVSSEVADRILARTQDLLRPGGRLIVSVPNEKCIPHSNHIRTFDAMQLRRLLKPYGKVVLSTEQPYKWLIMYVDFKRY